MKRNTNKIRSIYDDGAEEYGRKQLDLHAIGGDPDDGIGDGDDLDGLTPPGITRRPPNPKDRRLTLEEVLREHQRDY